MNRSCLQEWCASVILICTAVALASDPGGAEESHPFYQGKTVQIVVGFDPVAVMMPMRA
jgi:hypothetical protein